MIRKISNLSGLTSLEELNIRRNRIRSTAGLEAVPTIEKLYMSNNELQVMRYLLKKANIELKYKVISYSPKCTRGSFILFSSQNIESLIKIEALVKLHTVQMEGNPIWSLTEYSYHLVTALPKLTVLDQQEVSSEVRSNAQKWKSSQLGIHIDL